MTTFLTKSDAIRNLENRLAVAKDKIEKFAVELRENPFHTMGWADKTFLESARVYVYTGILKTLNNPKNTEVTIEGISSYCRDQALRISSSFTYSTSQCDNLARMAELQVWSELAKDDYDNLLCRLHR